MKRRWLLPAALLVALAQIGFLYSMIETRSSILRDGQEVVLSVEPIDPRDLLRGDYVILGYNISTVPLHLFQGHPQNSEETKGYRTVFVRLKADENGIWHPVAARYGEKPEPEASQGEVDIKGQSNTIPFASVESLRVLYGVERFYVPEGEGKAIEANLGRRDFRMRLAVAEDGTAQIKSFHDEDRMLYAEPLY